MGKQDRHQHQQQQFSGGLGKAERGPSGKDNRGGPQPSKEQRAKEAQEQASRQKQTRERDQREQNLLEQELPGEESVYEEEATDGSADSPDETPGGTAETEGPPAGNVRFGREIKIGVAMLVGLLMILSAVVVKRLRGDNTDAVEVASPEKTSAEEAKSKPSEKEKSPTPTFSTSKSATVVPASSAASETGDRWSTRGSSPGSRTSDAAARAADLKDDRAGKMPSPSYMPKSSPLTSTAPISPRSEATLTPRDRYVSPMGGTTAAPNTAWSADRDGAVAVTGGNQIGDPFQNRPVTSRPAGAAAIGSLGTPGGLGAASATPTSAILPSTEPSGAARFSPAATGPYAPARPPLADDLGASFNRDPNPLRGREPTMFSASPSPSSPTPLASPSRPASAANGDRVYMVREGDTLYSVAKRELGKATRWAEIYELNRHLLGQQLDQLTPGTQLVLPSDSSLLTRQSGVDVQR